MLGKGWNTYEVLKIMMGQTLVKVAMPILFVISDNLLPLPKNQNLQIDDYKERGEPAEDAELDEVIFDEGLCGTAA